jgi:hypothetical protein
MTPEYFSVREERIQALEQFSRALSAACRRCGPSEAKTAEAVRAALSAECMKCGIHVSGGELLAISETAEAKEPSAKVKRMRLGYCARDGCESFTYRLFFRSHPGADWPTITAQLEAVGQNCTELSAAQAAAKRAAARKARWRTLGRIGIALAIIGLLLVIRQWYVGGRIPLLREPEKFRVDPLPPGQEDSRH